MGQHASPYTTKLGLTMFWQAMWDDKLNYTKKLKEDIFINMFLSLILTGSYLTLQFHTLKNYYFYNNFFNIKDKNNFICLKTVFLMNLNNQVYKLKNFFIKSRIYYLSKLWILRFQSWLILILIVYSPQVTQLNSPMKFELDFLKRSEKSNSLNESLIVQPTLFPYSNNKNNQIIFIYNWYFLNFYKIIFNQTNFNKNYFFF